MWFPKRFPKHFPAKTLWRRPEIEEIPKKIREANHWNGNFLWQTEKEPFCCTTAVQRLTRYSTRFKTLVKTKIRKRPSGNQLETSGNLLGFNSVTKLGMLKVINQVTSDETNPPSPVNGDLESLFSGISKVKGKVIKLHIDSDVISCHNRAIEFPSTSERMSWWS